MPEVRVGVGIFIFKSGKFLMGRRLNSHGHDSWSIPGGHMEFGEDLETTAMREVMEETGLKIKNVRFAAFTNDLFPEDNKHYMTIWVTSDWAAGQPKITEPDKLIELMWTDFNHLPKPLFQPWNQLIESEFYPGLSESLAASVKQAGRVD